MVEDFIAGRHGEKTAEMLHPLLEPVLKDTFGVILYQEQVMQITSVLAGFSLGQWQIFCGGLWARKRLRNWILCVKPLLMELNKNMVSARS